MSRSDGPSQDATAAEHQRQQEAVQRRMSEIDRKLLVLSGKGGVGKSTVAVNLAVALAEAGHKVGLLDVDLHGPSIPRMLGLGGRQLALTEAEEIEPAPVGENLKVVSIAFLLRSDQDAVIWRGPRKFHLIRQFLSEVAWGKLDWLVIDSPPGTGDEPLAVAQMAGQGGSAVIVTTPQDVAVDDVRRCVGFCRHLSLPVAGIVENMSGLVCPHCGHELAPFKAGGGERLAAETGVPMLGRVPLDPGVVACGDSGEPFAAKEPDSPASRAFADIVRAISRAEGDEADSEKPHEEKQRVKIAIPTMNGRLSGHFGRCDKFALVEVADDGKEILDTQMFDPPPHEPGALPRWLTEHGADVVIAAGMGRRAQGLLAEAGIRFVIGAPEQSVEDLVSAYLAGTLEPGENVCEH
jgi:Mrp family chromosome partitioning ATPase/predicted Fe-Mo cluster-binding NifX family protein